MQRPPRARNERMVNGRTFLRSYGIIGVMESLLAFGVFFTVLYHGGWQYGDRTGVNPQLYGEAAAAFLATIIFCQIGNVLACRTNRQSALGYLRHRNTWIMAGIAVEVVFIFAIVYLPPLHRLFTTQPIAFHYWWLILGAPVIIFGVEELRKKLVRSGVSWLAV